MTDASRADKPHRAKPGSELAVLVVSVVVGLFLLLQVGRSVATRFDELGLGYGTSAQPASWTSPAGPAICLDLDQIDRCLPLSRSGDNRADTGRVLWIGYSQLYGINDYRPGQEAAPLSLRERLRSDGIELGAVAMPLINPREMLLTYEWVRNRRRIEGLVIPAWLQGTRGDGIRMSLQPPLNEPAIKSRLEQIASGPGILSQKADAQKSTGQYSGATGEVTAFHLQEPVEAAIVDRLRDTSFWKAREAIEARLSLLFRSSKEIVLILRNKLLGLKADNWIMAIPPSRHEINVQAFDDLIRLARRDGVKVLVYVPPRPVDERFPFDPELYRTYKLRIEQLARSAGAQFVNLEDSVKGKVWGRIDNGAGEIVTDVTHFTAEGHRQLGAALEPVVRSTFRGSAK